MVGKNITWLELRDRVYVPYSSSIYHWGTTQKKDDLISVEKCLSRLHDLLYELREGYDMYDLDSLGYKMSVWYSHFADDIFYSLLHIRNVSNNRPILPSFGDESQFRKEAREMDRKILSMVEERGVSPVEFLEDLMRSHKKVPDILRENNTEEQLDRLRSFYHMAFGCTIGICTCEQYFNPELGRYVYRTP